MQPPPATDRSSAWLLGSGSARGWAHIGVIRELSALGIQPDIVCGTSIGALVGAFHLSGRLDPLQDWVVRLRKKDILRFFDMRLVVNGGFVEGQQLLDELFADIGAMAIEDLPRPFGAVATDLASGHEIWFRDGPLREAIQASCALPGVFTPVRHAEQWLVDGGLVNPVPVSLCRAMGAELVIAVNLNGDIVGRHLPKPAGAHRAQGAASSAEATLIDKLAVQLKHRANSFVANLFESRSGAPGVFDVLASAINIMQFRITRSRMAGDPPDVIIAPRLAHIGLLEFDRGREAIDEGRAAVRRSAIGSVIALGQR